MVEQLVTLQSLSPRSLLMELMGMGLMKEDWQELLALGEKASRAPEDQGDLAAKVGRWETVTSFVIGYCGVAKAFGALQFLSEQHEAWCDWILEEIEQGIGDIQTRTQQERFERRYQSLVGGNGAAETHLRLMVERVRGRLRMLIECIDDSVTAVGAASPPRQSGWSAAERQRIGA